MDRTGIGSWDFGSGGYIEILYEESMKTSVPGGGLYQNGIRDTTSKHNI